MVEERSDAEISESPGVLANVDWPVFAVSGGFIGLFLIMALIDIDALSGMVNSSFAWSTKLFGGYWQLLMLSTFFIGLGLAFTRTGGVRLGNVEVAEIPTFKWIAIIMCTLLAGGGVFWAAAEPMAHFISPPPLFGVEAKTAEAAYPALAQSFMHWGFLAWAIQCSLTSIVLMYLHYNKGLPLKPRTLLYPVFGEKIYKSWIGSFADAACVIAVVAGTVGPIGFLGLQVSYGLNELFGLVNDYGLQLSIILGLIVLYTISAISGVTRGIQLLSTINVFLALGLMGFILVMGPTAFISDAFIHSFGLYLDEFIPMATFRASPGWLDWWTVFFWGWFLGYGPLMAMFICRISRGRTIREIVTVVSLLAPVVTAFWFTIIGGSGIAFEIAEPGVISEPFTGFNLPAAMFAITQQLPMGFIVSVLFLILTTIFVATTGDSMTYTVSMVMTGTDHPPAFLRIFWGIAMGLVAAILISLGSGGVSALQSFIVVTAVPVSLVLLPSLWTGPKIARQLAREQGLI
ncbi:BCCT family transporter [Motiliproteus sp. MSK22-1]|uniref:BCCT family transporter n=1 Tax=Motiliproteus sp. MSK22-1 TaxID=1897630 RepID=UPI000976015B|nr:BCCT family transporter [Motiliproteus sp. MSK22-1]OMH34053.1 BCCT transporter [Motiliproteus sp. MSK22-1]